MEVAIFIFPSENNFIKKYHTPSYCPVTHVETEDTLNQLGNYIVYFLFS